MAQGSCLCGTVRFEVCGPYAWMAHCHCGMCRKHQGGLFATNLGVSRANFRWLQGEETIAHYRSSEKFVRSFCTRCGSTVPDAALEMIPCPAGLLDGDLGIKPQVHIFVGSKSPLCEIADDLLQFEAYPPGYGEAVQRPAPAAASAGAIEGSCLCGNVAFTIDEAPRRIVNCYCSRCRRSRGAPHSTNFFVPKDQFHWVRGEDRVRTFKVPDAKVFGTGFCADCGSLLPVVFSGIDRYFIPVGSIDTQLTLEPGVNIFVGSKAPWCEIANTAPQFDEFPPRERLREFMF